MYATVFRNTEALKADDRFYLALADLIAPVIKCLLYLASDKILFYHLQTRFEYLLIGLSFFGTIFLRDTTVGRTLHLPQEMSSAAHR